VPRAPNGRAHRPVAAAEEPKATEAELAALRDKAASLERELKEALAAKGKLAKANEQEERGKDSKKNNPKVSEEEAMEKCKTHGEMKRSYPKLWKQRHDRLVKDATRVLRNYDNWRRFMSELDVSSMTAEERENHERMMEVFAKKHAFVRDSLENADKDVRTFAQDKANSDEIYRLAKEGQKLMNAERDALLRITAENLGRRLGWPGADTAEFVETLRAVSEVTARAKMN